MPSTFPPCTPELPLPSGLDARIAHLFRGPAGCELHPLWTSLTSYRGGTTTPPAAAAKPAALRGAAFVEASPLAQPIDRQAVQQRVRELPPLPQAALLALAALRDDHASTERCSELIARDQALVASLLRLANSAFYGVSGRVSSVQDAVQMLGRRTVGSLLAVATVTQQFDVHRCPSFNFSGFWRHALAVALASRALAQEVESDIDAAFLGGLLHDIGRLTLAVHFPDEIDALMQGASLQDRPLNTLELACLGTDHAEVGAWMAAHWHFAPDVVVTIAAHHQPPVGSSTAATLAALVHVADALVHALDLEGDAHERVPTLEPHAWAQLRLTPDAVTRAMASTEQGVVDLSEAMGL